MKRSNVVKAIAEAFEEANLEGMTNEAVAELAIAIILREGMLPAPTFEKE